MILASLSEFRKEMKNYVNKVIDQSETLFINRGNNKGIVVMSLDEYNSWQETMHEMSSLKNIQRIETALEKYKKGDRIYKELPNL